MRAALLESLEATWPPAEAARFGDPAGGLVVGRGEGGGGRLSSVRAAGPSWQPDDLDAALAQQDAWGEARLIRALDDDHRLSAAAEARGMTRHKPTVILTAPLAVLADADIPRVTGFTLWPPMAIQHEIWAANDIPPPRQAAMTRAPFPKVSLLGRTQERAGGAGFLGISGPVAGLHTLVVMEGLRGHRLAEWMIREAARWALDQNAELMALQVTRANTAALRLYARLGFRELAGYSYFES